MGVAVVQQAYGNVIRNVECPLRVGRCLAYPLGCAASVPVLLIDMRIHSPSQSTHPDNRYPVVLDFSKNHNVFDVSVMRMSHNNP